MLVDDDADESFVGDWNDEELVEFGVRNEFGLNPPDGCWDKARGRWMGFVSVVLVLLLLEEWELLGTKRSLLFCFIGAESVRNICGDSDPVDSIFFDCFGSVGFEGTVDGAGGGGGGGGGGGVGIRDVEDC